jgi:hypothetical protein
MLRLTHKSAMARSSSREKILPVGLFLVSNQTCLINGLLALTVY